MTELTTAKNINIKLLGKEYRITCPSGLEMELCQAAHYVDEQMRITRDQGGIVGLERIAVLSALNIGHELLRLRDQHTTVAQATQEKLHSIEQYIARSLDKYMQLANNEGETY